MDIKKAVFAGSWYPETASECENDINDYLKSPILCRIPEKEYIAGITPHAGWYFSGAIACNVIKRLKGDASADLVVIFGKHLHPSSPATILTDCICETPFGPLETANDFSMELAARLAIKKERADTFTPENTIEVQLPFVKYFFGDTKIVIIGAPPCEYSMEIGRYVASTARDMGLNIRLIGSSDMTHYGSNFGFTPVGDGHAALEWVKNKNDFRMLEAMIRMDGEQILDQAAENHNACCSGAVAATVSAAKALGAETGEKLAYSTSYDLSPGESFVGYAGVVY